MLHDSCSPGVSPPLPASAQRHHAVGHGLLQHSNGGSWPWTRNQRGRGKRPAEGGGRQSNCSIPSSAALLPGEEPLSACPAQHRTGTVLSRQGQRLRHCPLAPLRCGQDQGIAQAFVAETFVWGRLRSLSLSSMQPWAAPHTQRCPGQVGAARRKPNSILSALYGTWEVLEAEPGGSGAILPKVGSSEGASPARLPPPKMGHPWQSN